MAKRCSVTLTAEIPACRGPREPSGWTIRSPPVSGTTLREAPAGRDPTGSPFPSSVPNSSPSPPSVTFAAAALSPTRNSGSAPGVRGAGAACGRGHAAAARASRLASPRLAQGRVELCDGEVDVRIRVRAGDETRLEGRRREEHTPGERRAVPAREQARVRALRRRERAHGPGGQIDAPHRAGVTTGRCNPLPTRGVPYTRHQPGGSPLQHIVEAGALGLAQRRQPARHRPPVAAP